MVDIEWFMEETKMLLIIPVDQDRVEVILITTQEMIMIAF
jgi:hypothetical protein